MPRDLAKRNGSNMNEMTRRRFVKSGASVLLAPAMMGLRGTHDPRLTARPGHPTLTPEVGLSRIGPDLPRGGLLYVPESYTSEEYAPLIVALHGGGGYSGSWSLLFDECDNRGIVLMAPDSRGRSWDRVRGDFGPDVRFIDSALQYTFDRCAIDPARVALLGFSDGASYTLSFGVSNGDLFTHLIAFSPGFSDPAEPIVGRPSVFVSHGSDDRSLPVVATRSGLVPMFEMDGYSVEYVEFGGTHEIPDEVATRALDWFLQ
jgi:phospholipase/carboxylesterase